MQLISARLERVRQHRLLELRFARGFSLIAGANETGKSTVVDALHKALFLKATATGRGIEELRSLTHGGLPEVELRFAAAGSIWLLRKRFAGSGGTCQLSPENGPTLLGPTAETKLAELLQVSGPVEGRRIAQLPLRWAHLWVRQGEAGDDPLSGGGEAYDLAQLVQQLQQRSGPAAAGATAAALESPLDRQVQQQLQQQLDLQLTSTGKVRAGSALAAAQQRDSEARSALSQAELRLAELEAAMEELRQIGARLLSIDEQERPALLQERQRASQLQLLTAEAKPLQQQLAQLQSAQQQLHALLAQQQADGQQLAALQQQASHDQTLQHQHSEALTQLQQQHSQLEQQQQQLARQQEVVAIQRDLATLERQQDQLREHKQQFETLQQQAGAIKQQLQELPVITPEQVRQLRQYEQALAQAQARCQGMATRLSLLSRDQSVTLDDQPVREGEELTIEQPALLQIGSGTRLQLSPASGQASDAARQQREQAETQLAELQSRLAFSSSDAAEAVAQQRLALESELANLRKTAQTIPWAKLEAQLAELPPRRQRLLEALAGLDADPAPLNDLAALDANQDTLKQQNLQLAGQLQQSLEQRRALQRELDGLNQHHSQRQSEIGRLNGALAAAAAQLQRLQQLHGDAAELARCEHELRLRLEASEGRIDALKQHLGQSAEGSSTAETRLQQLESEKNILLTRRGQQEQLCRSLGASDPVAALEQLQAAWELAAAERQRLEQRTAALQLLLQLFRGAQQELGSRYCLPLQSALQGYLEALELPSSGSALMDYDPQEGFGALQLQQGNQSFGFSQLSGGMREQLAGGLRLALAEVLQTAYDNCLPLIFDDAFSNSDPQRREGVLRMLQRGIDRGLQILVFSCTPADFDALVQASGQRLDLPAREPSQP